MSRCRWSLRQLHQFFGSIKLEGFDDLTVVADDGKFEIKTSRLVFLSQSDYFKTLLRQKPLTKRVELKCGYLVLKTIFGFLLNGNLGNLDLDLDEVEEVMQMADFLGIAYLLDTCERAIGSRIDLERCLQIWAMGGKLNKPGLVKKAEIFLLRNLQRVLSSKKRSLAMGHGPFPAFFHSNH